MEQEDIVSKRFWVIGIVTEFIPLVDSCKTLLSLSNSGYSVAVPMDAVMDLVGDQVTPSTAPVKP
jgi:hypothetical protein